MPTHVDSHKVAAWKRQLPERLHVFLDNFFGTCGSFDPAVNYLNYRSDIQLYGRTVRGYRDYADDLIQAFYDITGWETPPGTVIAALEHERFWEVCYRTDSDRIGTVVFGRQPFAAFYNTATGRDFDADYQSEQDGPHAITTHLRNARLSVLDGAVLLEQDGAAR